MRVLQEFALDLQEHNHNLIEDNEYYSGIMNFYLLINSVSRQWPLHALANGRSRLTVLILWDLFAVLSKYGPQGMIMSIRKARLMNGEDTFKMHLRV